MASPGTPPRHPGAPPFADTGWTLRLGVLRDDAERNILEPLKRHGWRASVTREVAQGEYVVIVAERGGHKRNCALFYSSATNNSVYKTVEQEVDLILCRNGATNLESFAHGVKKPIKSDGEFHLVLLEWNRETSNGKFAPNEDEELETDEEESSDHRLLLSEAPIEAIWLRLRQLQSVRLAEGLIRDRATQKHATINAEDISTKAQGVAFALRNATDYFNASQTRNVSQRILNLYYGSMAFAFAEMLATPAGPATLGAIEDSTKQGHGLFTIDGATPDLKDLVVGVVGSAKRQGFFPAWMESLGKDIGWIPSSKAKDHSSIDSNSDALLTLEQLFARIPEVSDLFKEVFQSPAFWLKPDSDLMSNQGAMSLSFNGVRRPERTYIMLTDITGRLTREDVATFPGPISEIKRLASKGMHRRFRAAIDHEGKRFCWEALQIHSSPLGPNALIRPIFRDVFEYRAICFVLLYALSIIVRYRPSVWRRVQEGDLDHMRVLIEAFLAVVERVLPEHFLTSITGSRIFVKQPGSFF